MGPPENVKNKWNDIVQELCKAVTIKIPRCYFIDTIATNSTIEVHIFTLPKMELMGAVLG